MTSTSLNAQVRAILELALAEDIGTGDVTSNSTVPEGTRATGRFIAKSPGVLSGLDIAQATFALVDHETNFEHRAIDGDDVAPNQHIATVSGNARSILAAERVALNFLQRLSGVATTTRQYTSLIAGTGATVVDTRKTTPGMRLLEKEAVRHGGGSNHRFGLADGVLIKDNHLAAVGGTQPVSSAIERARQAVPHTLRIEVEVTNLSQVEEAVQAGADIIMLDNMSPEDMQEALRLIDGRAIVEASGGVTLETISAIAATGVDLISVGALTHSAPSLDISLDFEIAGT